MKTLYKISTGLTAIIAALLLSACDDFVKIDPPRTELVKETVFSGDATATAAIIDIYYELRTANFSGGDFTSISYLASLSSDEQVNYYVSSNPAVTIDIQQFNSNALLPNNQMVNNVWSQPYTCIYKANAVLEGLQASAAVSENVKKQLEGEAKFIRAFCHFYLVNMFGDVPLVVSTDYRINAAMPRTTTEEVYQQIIDDLREAQSLLPDNYAVSNNERVRVNKGTATALLARVYVYTRQWENAELQATAVINNNGLYSLVANLTEVFRATSTEAIFQLWSDFTPQDRTTFFVSATGPAYGALRPEFVNSFETGDQRWVRWGRTRVVSGVTYYYTLKYASFGMVPPLDYTTVMRLAEQYLIRAEARAEQNNFSGAQQDLNVIRHRAGLGDTPASDLATLRLAIAQERRHELFTEWGHRWFDLKRTGQATSVLTSVKPAWVETAARYPIPEYQILNNPAMRYAQNPGY